MSLLSHLFGIAGFFGIAGMPRPIIGTKREHATHLIHVVKRKGQEFGVFRIDHRALERNKYAPWGRGALGGKEV